MALETLKGFKEIGGFKIIRLEEVRKNLTSFPQFLDNAGNFSWAKYDELRGEYPIGVTDNINTISFKLQKGPIKKHGVNGCQVDTLIEAARLIIAKLNGNFTCEENETALYHLDNALEALKARKVDREKRGVEGLDKA